MNLAVVFPDAEELCVEYLTYTFAARDEVVSVATKVPNPRVGRIVKVTRTGGPRINVGMDAPQVVFEIWAPSEYEASQLAIRTRALVGAMDEFGSEISGVVNYPDGSNLPRYQFVAQLFTAGKTLT